MFGKKKNTEKKASSTKKTSSMTATKKPDSSTIAKTAATVRKTPVTLPETLYIANDAHYDQVIDRIKDVKKTLWIGTADIKELYVKDERGTKPLLEVLSDLVKKGVAIRLIHAKEPDSAFHLRNHNKRLFNV